MNEILRTGRRFNLLIGAYIASIEFSHNIYFILWEGDEMLFVVIKRKKLICFLAIFIITVSAGCMILRTAQAISLKYTAENNNGYSVLIYIDEKKLYLFKQNICIKEYPIASGKTESPSPVGQWKIIEKSDWGEGFGGRWLGLNVLWGTYGIHGTTQEGSIGYAVSHGCIRMLNKDIKELYDLVSIGTPVTIIDGPYGPFGTGFRELIPGDRGADVLAVQQKLRDLGYFNGQESGVYDDVLKQALYRFQRDRQLTIKYTITHDDYHAMGFNEFE